MKFKTLILCTGNSCRSIMFEALMNHYLNDKFIAFSAGSNPTGKVNELSIKTLQKNNIATENLNSKSWDYFKDQKLDLIITVCGNADNETCPVFISNVKRVHVGFDDPAKFIGNQVQKEEAFDKIFTEIRKLILEISQIKTNNLDDITESISNIHKNKKNV